MQRTSLLEALSTRVLLGDGANGTQLKERGAGFERGCEHWNVDRPEVVLEVHRAYVAAGSELITTNTFCGSSFALSRHGYGARSREFNLAGARLARQAAGPNRWVLGNIGPCGGLLDPYGPVQPDALEADFEAQATALLEGGADALLVETMSDPEEAALAVCAARAAGANVVLVSFVFRKTPLGFRTLLGADVSTALAPALREGANGVGANCGSSLTLEDYELLAGELVRHAQQRPVFLQPNAGPSASDVSGAARAYAPGSFAQAAPRWIAKGVRMLGGCCGTTPAHIAALRVALDAAAGESQPQT